MSHPVFTAAEVAAYVPTRDELRRWGPVRDVSEIGDGNINNVFRVRCAKGSFVLKQSMPYVRVDAAWSLSADRIHHEAEAYRQWARFAPEAVPELFLHDREASLVCVEDLADHVVWRTALDAGDTYPRAVDALGVLVARIAFHTGSLRVAHSMPSPLRACIPNPDMSALMDNLVFCEPYIEHERNTFPAVAAADIAAIRADPDTLRLVGRMRRRYVTGAEALIHGDLHTGSVMVSASSCKVIDCEFSAYGPVAWDLGQLAGNLLTAIVRAEVVGQESAEVAAMVPRLWDSFADELRRLWAGRADGDMTDAFLEAWLVELEPDARRFAACEILRRVIGNIVDFAALDEHAQGIAARGLLRTARSVLLGADHLDWAQCAAIARDAVAHASASEQGVRT